MATLTLEILSAVLIAAGAYDVPPSLILGVIEIESNFSPFALGDYIQGTPQSLGLMQLNIGGGAGTHYPIAFLLEVKNNVALGTRYLAACLEAFEGDVMKGVSAYNQGIQGVKDRGWEFNKPYVDKVLEAQKKYLIFDQLSR